MYELYNCCTYIVFAELKIPIYIKIFIVIRVQDICSTSYILHLHLAFSVHTRNVHSKNRKAAMFLCELFNAQGEAVSIIYI